MSGHFYCLGDCFVDLFAGLLDEKSTERKKKKIDGGVIQCMNVRRSRFLLINELYNTVFSNEFKTLMVMFRSFF